MKHQLYKLFCLLFVISLVLISCASDKDTDNPSEIAALSFGDLVYSGIKMEVGESIQLELNITPASAKNSKVIWVSSDETIVKVNNNGLITALAEGKARIIVSPVEGKASPAHIDVTVVPGVVFPDYEGGTKAYFAYQNPVRILVLGNDIYDNSLDNEHKCRIWSTMSGWYRDRDAVVTISIDESLCNNLYFTDDEGNITEPVRPMPTSYYKLQSNSIHYNGDASGYVEVQFSDDFFNDPKTIHNTYVIPVVMKSVTGIDGILTGTPRNGLNPPRTNSAEWEILPQDYVLYCVRYMNPWEARYIRRGVDEVTENGTTSKIVRKDFSLVGWDYNKENPVNQNDEVCGITTKNMTQAIFPVAFKTSGTTLSCNLILTFKGDKCSISTDDSGVTVTGTGEFIANGTERSEYKDYRWWSNNSNIVECDILRLAYNVDFKTKNIKVTTADTLVVQNRYSGQKEFFDTKYVK